MGPLGLCDNAPPSRRRFVCFNTCGSARDPARPCEWAVDFCTGRVFRNCWHAPYGPIHLWRRSKEAHEPDIAEPKSHGYTISA